MSGESLAFLSVIDGSGVGVAILDSGIDANHAQFLPTTTSPRILASVDFTGEGRALIDNSQLLGDGILMVHGIAYQRDDHPLRVTL